MAVEDLPAVEGGAAREGMGGDSDGYATLADGAPKVPVTGLPEEEKILMPASAGTLADDGVRGREGSGCCCAARARCGESERSDLSTSALLWDTDRVARVASRFDKAAPARKSCAMHKP